MRLKRLESSERAVNMHRRLDVGRLSREVETCEWTCSEHLCECRIERTQAGNVARVRSLRMLVFDLLVLNGQRVSSVPDRMRNAYMLREEQKRANEPDYSPSDRYGGSRH